MHEYFVHFQSVCWFNSEKWKDEMFQRTAHEIGSLEWSGYYHLFQTGERICLKTNQNLKNATKNFYGEHRSSFCSRKPTIMNKMKKKIKTYLQKKYSVKNWLPGYSICPTMRWMVLTDFFLVKMPGLVLFWWKINFNTIYFSNSRLSTLWIR